MKFSIREWRPAHLFGAWVSYWAILAGVTLGRPLLLLTRLRGDEVHGSASAHFDNSLFTAHVDVGRSAWDMTASLGTIFGWIAGPPLVIWAVYMATRPSRSALAMAPAPALDAMPTPTTTPALDAGDARVNLGSGERRAAERERVR